jgi:uncharacterized membrane protein
VAGTWRWPPTPSSAEVKERADLYHYSPICFRGLLSVNLPLTLCLCTYLAGDDVLEVEKCVRNVSDKWLFIINCAICWIAYCIIFSTFSNLISKRKIVEGENMLKVCLKSLSHSLSPVFTSEFAIFLSFVGYCDGAQWREFGNMRLEQQ